LLYSVNSIGNLPADVPSKHVPILKYINHHNEDGSYTYGYESADGSYKLETRLTSGKVEGKYGYIDTNGDLRETVYGADGEHGFMPVLVDVTADDSKVSNDEIMNLVGPQQQLDSFDDDGVSSDSWLPKFPRRTAEADPKPVEVDPVGDDSRELKTFVGQDEDIKIVNRRPAVLRRRLRLKKSKIPMKSQAEYQQQLTERQRQLKLWEEQLAALFRLQQSQASEAVRLDMHQPASMYVSEEPISFSTFESETPRSLSILKSASPRSLFINAPKSVPRFKVRRFNSINGPLVDPYVTGLDLSSGTYSIAY